MNVFKSSSKKVAVLKQIKFLRKPIFETVYYKTIIPSVLYLIVIQGFCFSVLIDDIDRVHLLANRIIYNLPHDIHCDDIMNALHWNFITSFYIKRLVVIIMSTAENRQELLHKTALISVNTKLGYHM